MKLQLEADDLRPLVRIVVTEVIERLEAGRAKLEGRLAYTEPEALLGVQPHVLGDARRRGEVVGTRVGKRILYERDQLLDLLKRKRMT